MNEFKQSDFSTIFRVRGKSGLFGQLTEVNKSNMVCMYDFETKKKIWVRAQDCECLEDYTFMREAGFKPLNISDVFNNINKNVDMVPNYDEDHFKPYHEKRIKQWYKILTSRYEN